MKTGFWQSIVNSKKAIVAGLAVVITFVSTTLAANHGASLSLNAWLIAVGAYVAAHAATYVASNAGSLPIGQILSALVTNSTVTGALVSLGVHPADISPMVEPTAMAPLQLAPPMLLDGPAEPISDTALLAPAVS